MSPNGAQRPCRKSSPFHHSLSKQPVPEVTSSKQSTRRKTDTCYGTTRRVRIAGCRTAHLESIPRRKVVRSQTGVRYLSPVGVRRIISGRQYVRTAHRTPIVELRQVHVVSSQLDPCATWCPSRVVSIQPRDSHLAENQFRALRKQSCITLY